MDLARRLPLVRQPAHLMDQTPTDLVPKPRLALNQARTLMDLALRLPLVRQPVHPNMDRVTDLALKPHLVLVLVRQPAYLMDQILTDLALKPHLDRNQAQTLMNPVPKWLLVHQPVHPNMDRTPMALVPRVRLVLVLVRQPVHLMDQTLTDLDLNPHLALNQAQTLMDPAPK